MRGGKRDSFYRIVTTGYPGHTKHRSWKRTKDILGTESLLLPGLNLLLALHAIVLFKVGPDRAPGVIAY